MASKSLDFNTAYLWPAPLKLLLGALIIVAILGLGWFVKYKEQKENLDSAKATEETLKTEFKQNTFSNPMK